ncbi:hypothetical protein CMK11_09385 [Candidatus Poribacteria bacterium]|nr:hypothetical protein [Candidatus Poribacteria bacterium]
MMMVRLNVRCAVSVISLACAVCLVWLIVPGAWGQLRTSPPTARLGTGNVQAVSYSPDGSLIAVGENSGIWLRDAHDSHAVARSHGATGLVRALTFTPGGRLLSAGADGVVRLWDVPSMQERRQFVGLQDQAHAVVATPDGTTVAAAGLSDAEGICMWDVATGTVLRRLSGAAPLSMSPDGRCLAASGVLPNTISLYDPSSGSAVGTLDGLASRAFSLAFSPGGRLLASGEGSGQVRVWDVEARQQIGLLSEHRAPVQAVAFAPDGSSMACGDRLGELVVWDYATGASVSLSGSETAASKPSRLRQMGVLSLPVTATARLCAGTWKRTCGNAC